MKAKIGWGIIAAVLVISLIAASVLYTRLKEDYGDSNLITTPTDPAAPEHEPTAPNFTVYNENGNAVSLSDFRGQPVVINFWTSWCYYCKAEMPYFDTVQKEYPQVQFMMLNATASDTREAAEAFMANAGYDFDVFFDTDGDAAKAYGVTGFPATYFIDENGDLITRSSGAMSYEALVKALGTITAVD